MIKSLRFALGVILLWSHVVMAAGVPFSELCESSAGKFLFNQTLPGTELVARIAGQEAGLLEGHVRLERALHDPRFAQLTDELSLRLARVRERFARRFPQRVRAVFEQAAPLTAAEAEHLTVLAGDELQIWQFEFVPQAEGAPRPLIYANSRQAFVAAPDLQARLVVGPADLEAVEILPPESEMFRFHAARVRGFVEWNDFPRIAPEHLQNLVPYKAGGLGNKGMFRATLEDGRAVIVKVSNPANRVQAQLLNEARMYLILNKLGLGPQFHGLIRFASGDYGFVTDFVPGTPFPKARGGALAPSFPLQASHADEIESAGRLLRRAGIRYAPDLQFILGYDGHAVLIDPEFLEFETPLNPVVHLPSDPVANTARYAENLRWELRMRAAREAAGGAPAGAAPGELPPEFRNIQVPIIGQH